MTDYPDFQRVPVRQTDNLLPLLSTWNLPPGTTDYGPFLVQAFDGVQLRVTLSAGAGTAVLTWYDDPAGAVAVGLAQWEVNPAWNLIWFAPAEGLYVKLQISNLSGVNMTGVIRLAGKIGPVPLEEVLLTNAHLHVASHAVPAGGSEIQPVPLIWGGAARLNIIPGDAAGKLNYQVQRLLWNVTGLYTLASVGNPAAPLLTPVPLLGDACGLTVINQDGAAAHSYEAALVLA